MVYDLCVVIPMYNASKTIIRALISVQNQTVNVNEIIIIDDGSTDDSFKIVNDFMALSNLPISIYQQVNSGVSSARNLGLLKSRSKYVAFLDSDDEWLPFKIEVQMPYFYLNDVVLVGGYHSFVNENNNPLFKEICVIDQFLKNNFQTSTVIVDRETAILFGGFYEMQKHAEEGRFYFEMLRLGKLILLNKQVVIYDGGDKRGFGQSGLSMNLVEMQRGEIANFRHAKDLHDINNFFYSFFYSYSYLKYFRRRFLVFLSKF